MIRKASRSKETTSIMLSSQNSQTSSCMSALKPSTTINTGSLENERTRKNLESL